MNDQQNTVSRTPAIAGFLIAGAVVLSLGFLGGIGGRDTGPAPELRIVSPATGDTVHGRVALRFRTPADLQLEGINGWVADDLHLHVMIDGVEVMPAAADISPSGDDFVWTLPVLEDGARRIYLTWAGRNHANVAGPSDTVVVHVTGGGTPSPAADAHAGH